MSEKPEYIIGADSGKPGEGFPVRYVHQSYALGFKVDDMRDRWPANRLERLKERWLPRWALNRWPVKYFSLAEAMKNAQEAQEREMQNLIFGTGQSYKKFSSAANGDLTIESLEEAIVKMRQCTEDQRTVMERPASKTQPPQPPPAGPPSSQSSKSDPQQKG